MDLCASINRVFSSIKLLNTQHISINKESLTFSTKGYNRRKVCYILLNLQILSTI